MSIVRLNQLKTEFHTAYKEANLVDRFFSFSLSQMFSTASSFVLTSVFRFHIASCFLAFKRCSLFVRVVVPKRCCLFMRELLSKKFPNICLSFCV